MINNTKYLVFSVSILALSFVLPQLYKIATDDATRYPFTYYSSVNNSFCYIDLEGKDAKRKDMLGNVYTDKEFDSILPMFYYRQLVVDGKLPDSLNGVEITAQTIRANSFYFRYRPRNVFSPGIKLYPLFESFSGKVNLELPGDVFRMGRDGIEFIDPETNQVKHEKSAAFSKVFQALEFNGPAKIVAGSPSPRKAYDEGYFIIDQNNNMFHLKMVNGKPFVKKTTLPTELEVVHLITTEYLDKRFYGFLFDNRDNIYYISTNNYDLVKIPVPNFSYTEDNLLIMANMFNWNISSTTNKGEIIYAVDAQTMEVKDSITYQRETKESEVVSRYLFPAKLSFTSSKHNFIKPKLTFGGFYFIFLNAGLLILYIVIRKAKKRTLPIVGLLGIVITGVFGFLSAVFIDLGK